MKTFDDCLEAVKPVWLDYDGISIRTIPKKDKVDRLPTERQAQQIINLKKMMVIAEAVGMNEVIIFSLITEVMVCGELVYRYGAEILDFIRICQDPDGDGDESKNLFNPFRDEK